MPGLASERVTVFGQVAGEKILIPPTAIISIEHERGTSQEEVEFQLKWPLERTAKKAKKI